MTSGHRFCFQNAAFTFPHHGAIKLANHLLTWFHDVHGCNVFAADFSVILKKHPHSVGIGSLNPPYLLSLMFEIIKSEFSREASPMYLPCSLDWSLSSQTLYLEDPAEM